MVKDLPLNSGKLIPLSPFVKDGYIHVGGRIISACIPYSSKHQVIISNNRPLASLHVFYRHVTNFQSGRELTLNLLKESYWLINAKSLIRKVLKSCLCCKRLSNEPIPPIMRDLPRIYPVFEVITEVTLLVLKENSKKLYQNLTKRKL